MTTFLAFALGLALAAEPAADDPFAAADAAAAAGKRAEAAELLLGMVADPALAPSHGEAWRRLATALAEVDLDVASLAAWHEALRADLPGTGPLLPKILALAAELGDEDRLAADAAGWLGAAPDSETRSRLGYLAARGQLRADSLGAAAGLVPLVDASSSVYADAKVVKGVASSLQGQHGDAVTAFEEALRAGKGRSAEWVETTQLNLARAIYAQGNWGLAIVQYSKVPRTSHLWPEAQYERAWAHFRAEDMSGTLALLMTHDTPFFDAWYFPEVDLLRAYGLFLMCKFPDATQEIDGFVSTWTPIRDRLGATLATLTPAQAFADARAAVDGQPTTLPPNVLRSFTFDDRLADAIVLVDRADDDLGRISSLGGAPLGVKAQELITARRDAVVSALGGRVLDRANRAHTELDEMLQGIEITRLDLLNLEAQIYEKAAATGTLEFGDRVGRLRKLSKDRPGFRVWPYQGEAWVDELGWYKIDARPDCPDGMARGE